jgi:hypothetical protein
MINMIKIMFLRAYNLKTLIKKGKVLVIYGPRRIGKTTLLNEFLDRAKIKFKLDSGDNIRIQQLLSSQDFPAIIEYAQGYEIIAIDEAQQIPNIGMGLKILVDNVPDLAVIATGSSSFDLAQKIGEPLTGRKETIILYPLSQLELLNHYNQMELKEKLPDFLVFGSYPEIVSAESRLEKIKILEEISNSYLFKDILAIEKIKSSRPLLELLKLLAFQVGSEVSLNELAMSVKIDVKTVSRYLDILEKAFVIKRLSGYSRNMRQEIVNKAKYYFWDNGIRNAIISQFNDLADRNDTGQLFENFIVMERFKRNTYKNNFVSSYFWRTYGGQEIDLVEEGASKLLGFEIKWSEKNKKKVPGDWHKNYPQAEYTIINKDNYLDFVS